MGGIVAVRCTRAARVRTLMCGVLLCAVLPGMGGCAWLGDKQSQLALRPTPGKPAGLPPEAQLFRPGAQRMLLPVPAARRGGAAAALSTDQLALWWLPHADPQAPVLLYLHGTFRNLYQNLSKIDALRDAGFAIVAVDYRGWGESTVIVPDEDTIAADARAAWAEVRKRQPNPQRRVIFGHSMGGAVAVRLASTLHAASWSAGQGTSGQGDYGALVLESTFTRMPDVAAAAGFWGRIAASFTTLKFDAASRIRQVDAPVLMLHGTADTTVPVGLGRNLRDLALQGGPPSVRWVEVAGGTHSQLHAQAAGQYRQAFADLIQHLGNPASPTHTLGQPQPTTPP